LPDIIPIDDPSDPRIAPYRAVRERDVVGRDGGFIAEGEVVLRVLGRSRLHGARSLLIAENRVAGLAEEIAPFEGRAPIYAANQAVMDAIVGFHIHRGVLAFGARGPEPRAAELLSRLPPSAIVVALFGVSNHDNIGGIFRNAAAFGASAVLLDGACCDPLYRKAIRVSVGGALIVPFARFAEGDDALALLENAGFNPIALSPSGATPLCRLTPPPRVALLLGAEGHGLAADILHRAATVSIPMAAGFDSLNVAVTSGIALHHLLGRARPAGAGFAP
jgi:tRNA G18 (ribose-2'-O)-methylase SpoU